MKHIRKSQTLYFLSIIIGLLGILQLISAWLVGEQGVMGDFSQGELYVNSLLFMIIAIWLAHGVMIHKQDKE